MTLHSYHDEEFFIPLNDQKQEQEAELLNNVVQFPGITLQDELAFMSEDTEAAESSTEQLADVTLNADPVRDYFRRINKVELLTAEEEVMLSSQIEIGVLAWERIENKVYSSESERRELETLVREGERSNDRMVSANLKLVVSIAKHYNGRGLPFIDLIQEGNYGLMHAVKKFDYKQGNKFSTYATWWIRQSINRAIADKGRNIRLPVHTFEKLSAIIGVQQNLKNVLSRDPTYQEIADEMKGIDADAVARLLLANSRTKTFSLNATLAAEDEEEFADRLPDDGPSVDDQVQKSITDEEGGAFLSRMMSTLPESEALVIRLRYGLGAEAVALTLEEVGQELNLSRERIRQIEGNALKRLKHDIKLIGIQDQSETYIG